MNSLAYSNVAGNAMRFNAQTFFVSMNMISGTPLLSQSHYTLCMGVPII